MAVPETSLAGPPRQVHRYFRPSVGHLHPDPDPWRPPRLPNRTAVRVAGRRFGKCRHPPRGSAGSWNLDSPAHPFCGSRPLLDLTGCQSGMVQAGRLRWIGKGSFRNEAGDVAVRNPCGRVASAEFRVAPFPKNRPRTFSMTSPSGISGSEGSSEESSVVVLDGSQPVHHEHYDRV